jgi:hypothetical protein
MGFLNKIEAAYLFILRIFILAAATLTLLIAAIGLAKALPLMSGNSARDASAGLPGGGLGGFIVEQRQSTEAEPIETQPATPTPDITSPQIIEAATLWKSYNVRTNFDVDLTRAKAFFDKRSQVISQNHREEYLNTIVTLMKELNASKGSPLTIDQQGQLLDWYDAKFQAQAEQSDAEQAAGRLEALQAAGIAGGALLAFLMIVFCFLVVKIERNLRSIAERPGTGSVATTALGASQ